MNAELQPQQRETWNTRAAFVLAAIGSAVGLGNLWGFPYKLYTYGGGAFLIPYFIAMAVIGIPLLIMEFSVGHWAQQGPPGAFGKILKKYRFVGWWLVALAFVIITYYAVILGYCVDYLVVSVMSFGKDALPWTAETAATAETYFLKDMVQFDGSMDLGAPALKIVAGTIVSWVLVYLCLFRGVKWVSKVVLITVPLPWIMLAILTVRGLTLEGAITGLEFYLEPRWGKLLEPATWRFAFGQVFFSMSLGFAVMLSYASFLHKKSDINNNALIIGLGDMATSFVAGIAVFSMLGGMAFVAQTSVPDLVPSGTVGLSFIVFPFGLSQLPAAAFFSCVFFLALLTLGIDSAFSIVEACLTSVCDSKPKWPRKYVLPAICVVGAALGIVFTASKGGLNWLDLTDGLINGPFGILIVALAECVVVGWAWKGKFLHEMREHANERSDWKLFGWWEVIIKYVAPALLSVLIVWSIMGEVVDERKKFTAANTPASVELQALAAADEEASTLAPALAAERDKKISELSAAGAVGPYEAPRYLIGGSVIFVLIPLVCWVVSSGRKGEHDADKASSARNGVFFSAAIMLVSAVVIGFGYSKGWFEPRAETFAPDGELNTTAYIFLGIGLVSIFTGLVWCFWKAMQAAGNRDPEMTED